jgi:hypothetical protein
MIIYVIIRINSFGIKRIEKYYNYVQHIILLDYYGRDTFRYGKNNSGWPDNSSKRHSGIREFKRRGLCEDYHSEN